MAGEFHIIFEKDAEWRYGERVKDGTQETYMYSKRRRIVGKRV